MKWFLLTIGAIGAFIFGVALFSPPKNLETPPDGIEKTILVGPVTKMCQGVATQRCLQIKENSEDAWQNYYGEIDGFEHQVGNEYHLHVQEETVPDAPADASTVQLVLVEILDWKEVPYIAITTPTDHDKVQVGEPVIISGTGRGLFENNVVVQVGANQNLVTQEVTTMTTSEVGGEGVWELVITVEGFVQDTSGEISAYSPSPKDGEDGYRYTTPVIFSVTGGAIYPLENTDWQLKSLMKEDISGFVQPEGDINAVFTTDGTLGGSSGCNNYSTSYKVDGNDMEVSEQIALTRMACPDPLMSQEQLYLTQLSRAGIYSVSGIELSIMNELGESLLIYNVAE